MATGTQLNVWLKTRHAAATRSMSEQSIRDASSDTMLSPTSERATGAFGRKQRVGASCDDAALVRAALLGQAWAQREIWRRFAPMVYGLFRRALSPRCDHDDLTQEVFLRVFRNLGSLERASAIRSFVYSVAVRVVSEEVRRFAWRRRISERQRDLSTPSTSPPANFEVRETLLFVQRILGGMGDKYRAVFVLRYVDGMDLEEIALGLRISRSSVKRYLAKSLASVYKSVAQEEAQGGARLGSARPASLSRVGQ